jgi:hypothetical protein
MPEIYSLSKSSKVQTGFLPLEDLLDAFYEDNARQHSLELDLEDLAMRLLALGWCEHVTYNQKLNRIVDGHGRVLACKWLSERSPDWFALQLKFAKERTEKQNKNRSDKQDLSPSDEERYSPEYWQQVSIIATTLTDDDHAAMNLGLNAEKAFGVDDPDKVNKLLSGLDEEEKAIAGFSAKVKQAIATYADTVPNDNDYQDKQHFERPDATDYSVRDRGDHVKDGDLTEYDEEPERVYPKVLNLAITWGDRKKWGEWGRENGTKNDTDAFWQGLKQRFPDDLG